MITLPTHPCAATVLAVFKDRDLRTEPFLDRSLAPGGPVVQGQTANALHLKGCSHRISGLRWGWTTQDGEVVVEGTAGRTFARRCLLPMDAEGWPEHLARDGVIMAAGVWREEDHRGPASFAPLIRSESFEQQTLSVLDQLIIIDEANWLEWLDPTNDVRRLYDA